MLFNALDEVTRIALTLTSDDHNVFWIYHNAFHTVSILFSWVWYSSKLGLSLRTTIGYFGPNRQIVYEAERGILMGGLKVKHLLCRLVFANIYSSKR